MVRNQSKPSISAPTVMGWTGEASLRHPGRWLTALALPLLGCLLLCFSATARAETILLPCEADATANQKRLIKAIDSANSTAIADTLVLTTNCHYRFAMPLVGNGVDALPVISNTLTIEGNGATIGATANAVALRLLHTTANLTLRNLNLYPGQLAGEQGGAAIRAESGATLTLQTVTVDSGRAPFGGGVAALGALDITDGRFTNNIATVKGGGAIYAEGPVTITHSSFTNNRATLHGGALALAVDGGPAHIVDSNFAQNRAGGDGGAINAYAPVLISTSDFYTNSSDAQGGAIYGEAPLTLHNSSLRQNAAGSKGGALMNLDPLTITQSIFLNNQSQMSYGGAIYASSTVALERNVFEANHGPLAGAVLFLDQQRGKSVIASNLWLDNFTAGFPKQPLLCAVCDEFGGGTVAIQHNTFVQSGQQAETAIGINAGTVDLQYNIIVNHTLGAARGAATVNASRNLYFGNRQDEVNLTGSDNITGQDPQFVRPFLKDYRLAAASPALDQATGSLVALDAQGIHRPQHGVADIGAYEVDYGEVPESDVMRITFCPATTINGLAGLTEAIAAANLRPGRQRIVSPGCDYVYHQTTAQDKGLPAVTDALIIDGNGSTIRYRNDTSEILRFLRGKHASLALTNLTLRNSGQTIDGKVCAIELTSDFFPPAVATLTGVTIKDNLCSGQGAALYAENYAVYIRTSHFENNGLIDNDSRTAVIDSFESWLEVDQSTFIGTAAPGNSSAIIVTSGGFDIHDSTFVGHHASQASGLYVNANKLSSRLANNLWLDNQPGLFNGAVVLMGNTFPVAVLHNTFANQAPTNGKAIFLFEPSLSATSTRLGRGATVTTDMALTVTVRNTIFANISGALVADQPGRALAISHNLFWHSAPVGDPATAINADPRFVDLANGDLHLQTTSPAIDAGTSVTVTHDKAGVARPAGAGFDIGAYEFIVTNPPPPPPTNELRAVDDTYLVSSGEILTVTSPGVLRNDSFSQTVPVQVVRQEAVAGAAGQLRLNADGSFTYTPAPGFTGEERFVYYLQAGVQKSNPATVTITVVKPEAIQRAYLPAIRR